MRLLTFSMAAISVLAAPVQAASLPLDATHPTMGTFVGVRFQMSLGGGRPAKPRTSLNIAPTLSRFSNDTVVRTAVGEGLSLDLGQKPTFKIAGVPVEQALGMASSGNSDLSNKQNLSTGGWIAVGVGVAAVAGGLFFLHLVDEAEENSD